MNEQEKFWAGVFGDEYTERNRVGWRDRIKFFSEVLKDTNARSILEVGCNAGWNLMALRECDPTLDLVGVEINPTARMEAKRAGFTVHDMKAKEVGDNFPHAFDMVFTAGVLIHIPPLEIHRTMDSILNASRGCVMAVEYYAPKHTEIKYRGHDNRLWKGPFGDLYEGLGLNKRITGMLSRQDGFDNCHYWILEK